ncbi:hypothetical protein FRB99_002823 [Tulasnella sp. 403]|nr:hypothetical protein FRB99_002823 [Tulasnella sp. 403]
MSRDYAFRFLIAAKAAIVEVPEWCEPQGWWETEGRLWLGELSKRLDVDLEWLPPEPTPADVATFANEIPPEEHQSLVLSLLSICLLASTAISPNTHGEKSTLLNYSASTRTFLCQTLTLLSVDQKYLLLAEDIVADGLYNELKVAQMKAKSDAARKEQEQGWGGKWGRWAATAGGVILGGLAIGLTSGLAAPALLPLLPFLTASSAPVVIGTLFGLTGGGLAGLRVNKRWAGVDTFEFIQITGGAEDGDSGSILSQEGAMDNTRAPSLVATILVPGILLESENEAVDGLRQCAHLFSFPRRDTFVLSHSPSSTHIITLSETA